MPPQHGTASFPKASNRSRICCAWSLSSADRSVVSEGSAEMLYSEELFTCPHKIVAGSCHSRITAFFFYADDQLQVAPAQRSAKTGNRLQRRVIVVQQLAMR